jgi:hypothetical protein
LAVLYINNEETGSEKSGGDGVGFVMDPCLGRCLMDEGNNEGIPNKKE